MRFWQYNKAINRSSIQNASASFHPVAARDDDGPAVRSAIGSRRYNLMA
jgi:hypothetical protein